MLPPLPVSLCERRKVDSRSGDGTEEGAGLSRLEKGGDGEAFLF